MQIYCITGPVQNAAGQILFSKKNIGGVMNFFLSCLAGPTLVLCLQSKFSEVTTFLCYSYLSMENQQIDSVRHFVKYIFE